MKKPNRKCCNQADIKNEGYVIVGGVKVWEYHCYHCDKTWTEEELTPLQEVVKEKIEIYQNKVACEKCIESYNLDKDKLPKRRKNDMCYWCNVKIWKDEDDE